MFNDMLVVESAVSAFNNAALVAPVFLWNAVLCIPLFALIYLFGRHGVNKLGLENYVTRGRAIFWTIVITATWIVLSGGNYAVLRDGVSVLPWVTAFILFASMLFFGINTRAIKLPIWYGRGTTSILLRWLCNLLVLCIILVPVALSDTLNWWGPILQTGAVLTGFVLGRWTNINLRGVPVMVVVLFCSVVAVLMQPEYFRFGQLGNLTPIHLLWILGTGLMLVIAFVLDIILPCARIHNSAYTKLKWLLRFVGALCAVLFLLTESVPMFIASTVVFGLLFAMSVWHADKIDESLPNKCLALAMVMFGVLISVPTITAIGVLLFAIHRNNAGNARFLL